MTPAELRAWRTSHALGPVALARLLGVRYETIGRWERGDRAIPAYLALALAGLDGQQTIPQEQPKP